MHAYIHTCNNNMTTYKFEATPTYEFKEAPPPRSSRHRRDDSSVGSGSLTYSAGSSVHSATGESTDSSFGDIMKVLDGENSSVDIAAYLQQKGYGHASSLRDERSIADSLAYSTDAESMLRYDKSVVDSLAYSTDAESNMLRSMATEGESTALMGTDLISTVTGQPSAQTVDDHGVLRTERQDEVMQHEDIFFSPAEYTDGIKRRKDRKRQERRKLQAMNKTPRAKNLVKTAPSTPELVNPKVAPNQPFSRSSSAAYSPQRLESRQGTPPTPRRPPKSSIVDETMESACEDDDVWYAKWWMFCFPETVNNATQKR